MIFSLGRVRDSPKPMLVTPLQIFRESQLRAAMGGFSFPLRVLGRHNIALHTLTPRVESLYARARLVVKSVAIFI